MAKDPGRFWPGNLRKQTVTTTGIDQRAQGIVGLLERTWSRGMQGFTGTFIGGNSAAIEYKWSGYTDYVRLAQTRMVAASTNLRSDPNVALPATGGPLLISAQSPANAVMNALAQMPPGYR